MLGSCEMAAHMVTLPIFLTKSREEEEALELGRVAEESGLEVGFESAEEGGTTPWFGSNLKLPSCI